MLCRMSSTCRLLHFPQRPSCHIRPFLGARTALVLRLDGGACGQQHLDHLQVALRSRIRQGPGASVRRARLQLATGGAKSQVVSYSHSNMCKQHVSKPKHSQLDSEVVRTFNNLPDLKPYTFSGFSHLR